jgi:hypothetical protein
VLYGKKYKGKIMDTELCVIMSEEGSDKSPIKNNWHNYTVEYYSLFKDKKNDIINVFEYVEIIYAHITYEDDIYSNVNTKGYIPELGLTSGPNILFFTALGYCTKYNTILLLETDCFLKPEVFEVLSNYVDYAGDFYISGAVYCGTHVMRMDHKYFFHLNGVAMYNTGNPLFQNFIEDVYTFMKDSIKNGDHFLPYDVGIMLYVLNLCNDNGSNFKGREIFSRLQHTRLIVNYSPHQDKDISLAEVNGKFPLHVILHKKR